MIQPLGGGPELLFPRRGETLQPVETPNCVTHLATVRMFQTPQLKLRGARGKGDRDAGQRAASLALGEEHEGKRGRPWPTPVWGFDTHQLSPRQARHSALW